MTVAELPLGSHVVLGEYVHRTFHGHQSNQLRWTKVSNRNDFMAVNPLNGMYIFDWTEPLNPIESRRNNGNNFYPHSNIHQWLNSFSDANSGWFVPAHEYDTNVRRVDTRFFADEGFLSGFAPEEYELMETVKISGPVPYGSRQQHGKVYDVGCKVYLPSDVELTGRKWFNSDECDEQPFELFQQTSHRRPIHATTRTPFNKSYCAVCALRDGVETSIRAYDRIHVVPCMRLKPDTNLTLINYGVYGIANIHLQSRDNSLLELLGNF